MAHSSDAAHRGSQSRCQMGFTAEETQKSAPLSPNPAARRSSPAAISGSSFGRQARPANRWGLLLQKSAIQEL